MSYILSSTGTKSPDHPWFIQIDPDTVSTLREWEYSQPGLLGIDIVDITDTFISVVYQFENKEFADSFMSARLENPLWQTRDQYYKNIGLTSNMEVLSEY